MSVEFVWGDCMKPGKSNLDINGKEIAGAFTWADNFCDDFEPLKTSVHQPSEDFLLNSCEKDFGILYSFNHEEVYSM